MGSVLISPFEVNAMRPVFCAILTLLPLPAADGTATVVLKFEHRHSKAAVGEMKAEARTLLKSTGVSPDWREAEQLSASESFSRLIVVEFRGFCQPNLPSPPPIEPRALGYTYVSDGEPMPFSVIDCDRVRASLRSSPYGTDETVFGRALGKVLAHELRHIIDRTVRHTPLGCMKKSFSYKYLMADSHPSHF
jgi:hypothetical protein